MPAVRDDPYPACHFRVDVDGLPMADFAEVSGLSIEVEVLAYRSGDDRGGVRKVPGLARFGDVTLKRGTTGRADLFQWMKAQVDGAARRSSVSIILLAEDGSEAMRWNLFRAFPRRLALGPLVAGAGSILVEELVLAIEGLELAS